MACSAYTWPFFVISSACSLSWRSWSSISRSRSDLPAGSAGELGVAADAGALFEAASEEAGAVPDEVLGGAPAPPTPLT